MGSSIICPLMLGTGEGGVVFFSVSYFNRYLRSSGLHCVGIKALQCTHTLLIKPSFKFPSHYARCTLRILPFDLFSPSQILLLFHAARVFKGPRYFCQLLQAKVTQLPTYQSVAGLIARSSPRSVKSHDSYNKPCKAKPPPFRDFALGPFSYPGTGRRAVFETCNDSP